MAKHLLCFGLLLQLTKTLGHNLNESIQEEIEENNVWFPLAIVLFIVVFIQCLLLCNVQNNESAEEDSLGNIKYEELTLGNVLGKGTYGVVYQGKWRGSDVAIKQFNQEEAETVHLNSFIMEVTVLYTFRHPNCVLFMGACFQKPNLCIVTELLKTSMYDWIHSNPKPVVPWVDKARIILDVSMGMLYLHQMGVFHHDLKSPNLLLSHQMTCKVADFGMISVKPGFNKLMKKLEGSSQGSDFLQRSSTLRDRMGSPFKKNSTERSLVDANPTQAGSSFWAAPEIVKGEEFTEKADVYSLGIILAEIINMRNPYPNMSPLVVVTSVASEGLRPTLDSKCPKEMSDLAKQCWHENVKERPTFEKIALQLEDILIKWRKNPPDATGTILFGSKKRRGSITNLVGLGSPVVEKAKEDTANLKWWLLESAIVKKTPVQTDSKSPASGETSLIEVKPGKLKQKDVKASSNQLTSTIMGSMAYTGSVIFSQQSSAVVKPEDTAQDDKYFLREIKFERLSEHMLSTFRACMEKRHTLFHPCIEHVVGGWTTASKGSIVSKLYSCGSAKDLLQQNKIQEWTQRLGILEDIVSGLQYLHSQNIIHKNIKSSNILCTERIEGGKNKTVKYGAALSDFGFSNVTKILNSGSSFPVGTPAFLAPEVLIFEEWGLPSDIYALGILMWELISSDTPFDGVDETDLLRSVTGQKVRPLIPPYDTFPDYNKKSIILYDAYVELMESCWSGNIDERPLIVDITKQVRNLISMELKFRYRSN